MLDIDFGTGRKSSTIGANRPAVAMNDPGNIVLATEATSQPPGGAITVRSGKVTLLDVEYASRTTGPIVGKQASVALDSSNRFLLAYNAGGTIRLIAGRIPTDRAPTTFANVSLGSGDTPSVAFYKRNDASKSGFFAVYISARDKTIRYTIGNIAADAVGGLDYVADFSYKKNGQPVSILSATTPKIAFGGNNYILAYRGQDTKIYVLAGERRVDPFHEVELSMDGSPVSVTEAEASSPSIVLSEDGTFIITYTQTNVVYRRIGALKKNGQALDVTWSDAGPAACISKIANADRPQAVALAANSNFEKIVEVHTNADVGPLITSVSLVVDRSRWMETYAANLKDKPMYKVTLPGSHDAGAYRLQDKRSTCPGSAPNALGLNRIKNYALTQDFTIRQQLDNGTRFFDLRPAYDNDTSTIYAYHDLLGPSMSEVLADVAAFLTTSTKELVVLKVSHFCSFTDERHASLISLIKEKLGSYLNNGISGATFAQTKFSTVLETGAAYVWYDDTSNDPHYQPYNIRNHDRVMHSSFKIYDSYARSTDVNRMMSDQLTKMQQNAGTASSLFLLSFTLTADSFTGLSYSYLRELVANASQQLASFVQKNIFDSTYNVNVLYVDFVEDARSTDCAILLNRRSTT